MRKIIKRLILLIEDFLRIHRLPVQKQLKIKIRTTWFKVFFLKRYDSRNKMANIAGFKMKFLDYWNLTYLFNEIFIDNEYYFVAENNRPYIIDCGCNIGMSILYFKMLYPYSRILAFEPGEETYSCVEENVKDNKLDSVAIQKTVLSNIKGTIDFYYDQDNLGSLIMSTKQERMPKQRRSVKASLLSEHIDKEVDFLKIDIEGAELEVIEELINAKKLNYVKQMVIEYHHHIVKELDMFSKMLRIIEDAGFGYQIESKLQRPFKPEQFQDIIIYAYQKKLYT